MICKTKLVEGVQRGKGREWGEVPHLNRALESPSKAPHLWIHSGHHLFIYLFGQIHVTRSPKTCRLRQDYLGKYCVSKASK